MTYDASLAPLQNPVRTSNGHDARCPAHDDHKQSLSVAEANNGSILLTCHAVCSVDQICNSLGIKTKALFPEPAPTTQPPYQPPTAEYIYRSPDGSPVLKVTRHPGKKFLQWHLEGSHWKPGVRGLKVPIVPYRLPPILQAIAEELPVLVVEGEKDCD